MTQIQRRLIKDRCILPLFSGFDDDIKTIKGWRRHYDSLQSPPNSDTIRPRPSQPHISEDSSATDFRGEHPGDDSLHAAQVVKMEENVAHIPNDGRLQTLRANHQSLDKDVDIWVISDDSDVECGRTVPGLVCKDMRKVNRSWHFVKIVARTFELKLPQYQSYVTNTTRRGIAPFAPMVTRSAETHLNSPRQTTAPSVEGATISNTPPKLGNGEPYNEIDSSELSEVSAVEGTPSRWRESVLTTWHWTVYRQDHPKP